MRAREGTLVALASLALLAGCSGDGETDEIVEGPPPGYVAPEPTAHLPQVAHPEFANWNKFPVGTFVVRKKEVTNDFGTVRVTSTLRLLEKTGDKVVVESQVTVAHVGRPIVENPPQQVAYPATFPLPKGMRAEQFALPALKAQDSGEEVISACGRDFTARLFVWEERNESGPMTVKHWRSDQVPGRMLRQEIRGHMHDSVEEVVEIYLASSPPFQSATADAPTDRNQP